MSCDVKEYRRSISYLLLTVLVVSIKLALFSMFFREDGCYFWKGNYPWADSEWYWNHISINSSIVIAVYFAAYMKYGKQILQEDYVGILKLFLNFKVEKHFLSLFSIVILIAILIGSTSSWADGLTSLVYLYVLACECSRL